MKVNHKTQVNRLQLHRETFLALNHAALAQVQGGREAFTGHLSCSTSGYTCA